MVEAKKEELEKNFLLFNFFVLAIKIIYLLVNDESMVFLKDKNLFINDLELAMK